MQIAIVTYLDVGLLLALVMDFLLMLKRQEAYDGSEQMEELYRSQDKHGSLQ